MGWRNLHAAKAGLRVAPCAGWTVHADGHLFWLAQRRDAWYGANGGPIRRNTTGAAKRHVGAELDVYVKGTLWERLTLWVGWSHFFPGGFIEETPGDDDPGDWVFVSAALGF